MAAVFTPVFTQVLAALRRVGSPATCRQSCDPGRLALLRQQQQNTKVHSTSQTGVAA